MSKTVFGALPTPEDIRAARAWLGWTQAVLGEHVGLSSIAIANIEKKKFNATAANLQKIQSAFFDADIEFLPGGGFKKRSDLVRVLEGDEGVKLFYNDLATAAEEKDIDILIYAVGEEELVQKLQNHPVFTIARNRMLNALGSKVYMLRSEMDKDYETVDHTELRRLPADRDYPALIYFVYDDKISLITDRAGVNIFTVRYDEFSELFRRQFNRYWEVAGKNEVTS